jgi:hypothetical protein
MQETLIFQEAVDQNFYGEQAPQRSTLKMFFRTIPPERVGPTGDYDHSGLAKRVQLKLHQSFGAEAISNLRVTQRGRVVIFSGQLDTPECLSQLVKTTLRVYGTDDVETHGVRFSSPQRQMQTR